MIKLDESDIKAIANNRFFKINQNKLLGYLLGVLVAVMAFLVLSNRYESVPNPLLLIPFLGFVAVLVWMWRGSDKAKKELLEEWNKGAPKGQIDE